MYLEPGCPGEYIYVYDDSKRAVIGDETDLRRKVWKAKIRFSCEKEKLRSCPVHKLETTQPECGLFATPGMQFVCRSLLFPWPAICCVGAAAEFPRGIRQTSKHRIFCACMLQLFTLPVHFL